MNIEDLDLGDVVYAAHPIIDDGSMPDGEEGALLVQTGVCLNELFGMTGFSPLIQVAPTQAATPTFSLET